VWCLAGYWRRYCDVPSGSNGGVKLDGREEVRQSYLGRQRPNQELPTQVAEADFNFNNRSSGMSH
jgi:hypothetical protein